MRQSALYKSPHRPVQLRRQPGRLPGLLRIAPGLTPLAAAGLVVLMVCATILTPILMAPDPVLMLLPATVGLLAACVGYARLRLAPLRGRA